MLTITPAQLRSIMPAAGAQADVFAKPLNDAMARFMIATPSRQAMFLASVGYESACLICVEERLKYSAEGLLKTWPKHFDAATAEAYQYQPEKIANRAYADRDGNGNEASGDGFKYRGRGPIQITGHKNYAACGASIGQDLVNNPDLLLQPEFGALAAGWFWSTNHLNAIADAGDFRGVTKGINGSLDSYEKRLPFLMRAESVIGQVK